MFTANKVHARAPPSPSQPPRGLDCVKSSLSIQTCAREFLTMASSSEGAVRYNALVTGSLQSSRVTTIASE